MWAADGLTLSKRTTQAQKRLQSKPAVVIAEAVKKGQTVQKAALALFDGYGYGHTLPEQDIPDFLKQLTQIAKAKEYGVSITILITAMFLCSIHEEIPKSRKNRPIALMVPVNLRNYFPSQSMANFLVDRSGT